MYYIYTELIKQQSIGMMERMGLRWQYMYYKFNFFCYDLYYMFSSLFKRNLNIDSNNQTNKDEVTLIKEDIIESQNHRI